MILTTNNMRYTQEMIIQRNSEVHQGIDHRVDSGMKRLVKDAKRRKVPHRRIRMVEIGPDPD